MDDPGLRLAQAPPLMFIPAAGAGQNEDVPPAMTLAHAIEPTSRPGLELGHYLRAATRSAHEELERGLDLLSRVSDRRGFLHVLERFYGFHLVWERAIHSRPDLQAFHEPRRRLPHLRRDLAALGRTAGEVEALANCAAALSLAHDRPTAIGSIYVMEGSTLGGQMISRALAEADWPPPGGLTYFDPYGRRTGEMWRGFQAWAEGALARRDREAAAEGARRTFALLGAWLVP